MKTGDYVKVVKLGNREFKIKDFVRVIQNLTPEFNEYCESFKKVFQIRDIIDKDNPFPINLTNGLNYAETELLKITKKEYEQSLVEEQI